MRVDVKLAGGLVIDGTGAPAQPADVAIAAGTIVAVGDLAQLEAERTIDCAGLLVTPGFIDIHSHGDWLLPDADHGAVVEPFIRQGVTTVVAGNCGFSPAPVSAANRPYAHEASRLVVDDVLALRWESMAGFLDALAAGGVAINVAQLVGHGTVRSAVTGALNPAPPSADELARMERLTREALDAGCVGVSTGLGYPPGIFAEHEELVTVARWAAAAGKLFTSHLRAYSRISGAYTSDPADEFHNLRAIREILAVARAADARLQISHLIFVGRATWPSHPAALELIGTARAEGLDVAFDAFPYTAGNTTASVLLPAWLLPRLEEVLASPEERANLRAFAEAAFAAVGFGLPDIQIMHCNVPGWDHLDGLRIPAAAAALGMDPFDFYCRLVLESRRNARVLIHTYSGDAGDEEALRAVLRHPLCTIETDAFVTRRGHQNPAAYGTFPRVLSTYVRAGLFTLETAVHRMTGAAAERLRWTDRGWVRPRCAADLVVLDPAALSDTATFEHPDRFPRGVPHVFINGRPVVDGGRYDAAARAGRVLRS